MFILIYVCRQNFLSFFWSGKLFDFELKVSYLKNQPNFKKIYVLIYALYLKTIEWNLFNNFYFFENSVRNKRSIFWLRISIPSRVFPVFLCEQGFLRRTLWQIFICHCKIYHLSSGFPSRFYTIIPWRSTTIFFARSKRGGNSEDKLAAPPPPTLKFAARKCPALFTD